MKETEHQHILETWIDEHKALLFKVIRAYAFTESDREDLFQEVVIQVWRSVPNFREQSSVSTWIYRVALNTAIKWNREEQKNHEGQQPFENMEHLLQQKEDMVDERLEWLYRQIGKLDRIDRSLCLLMLDGFSYREISRILGITESNVGVKINRIKKHLIRKSEEPDSHGI